MGLAASRSEKRVSTSQLPATQVTVVARTIGGEAYSARVTLRQTVGELKDALAAQSVSRDRQKLLLGSLELHDFVVLGAVDGFIAAMDGNSVESHLAEGSVADSSNTSAADSAEDGREKCVEVTLVVMPPRHPLDVELGLGREHPDMLRAYFETHGLQEPEWLNSDEQVWDKLQQEHGKKKDNKDKMHGWGHLVRLSSHGTAMGTLEAKPSQELSVTALGFVHNNKGDTCIHQVVLAVDTQIAAEVSDGVPMRGKTINKQLLIKAPAEPGTYMLWSFKDLQYSMRDACNNFRNQHGQRVTADKYPGNFVGWLVVEA